MDSTNVRYFYRWKEEILARHEDKCLHDKRWRHLIIENNQLQNELEDALAREQYLTGLIKEHVDKSLPKSPDAVKL